MRLFEFGRIHHIERQIKSLRKGFTRHKGSSQNEPVLGMNLADRLGDVSFGRFDAISAVSSQRGTETNESSGQHKAG